MIRVESSNVFSLGYDYQNNIVQVEFHRGGVYRYYDVPEDMFASLLDASSVGTFLHLNYKKHNQYKYKKVR